MADLTVTWNDDGTCTVTGEIEASSPEEAERIMRHRIAEAAFEARITPVSIETKCLGNGDCTC